MVNKVQISSTITPDLNDRICIARRKGKRLGLPKWNSTPEVTKALERALKKYNLQIEKAEGVK